jgi:glycosyltransferase involved in cell wall biosynthesis
MRLFSEHNRVLYIEPPLPYFYSLLRRWRWSKSIAFLRGMSQKKSNLWITTCPPALPFKGISETMERANQRLMLMWVRRAARKLGFKKPILWLFTPPSVAFAGKLDEDLLVYHCLDEFTTAPVWAKQRNIVERERSLLAKADLVITCSINVYDAKVPWCKEIINTPNGVDFDAFNSALDEATPIAPRLNKGKAPIIGFYGTLNFRIDEDFLMAASRRYPHFQFFLMGPAEKKFPELKKLPNVTIIGNQPIPDLPSYLKGFDVCLIPYKMNEFVKSISPLKVYEYLSAGKPVVVPNIRAIQDLGDLVFIGRNQEEMVDLIGVALGSNSPEVVNARIEKARQNTWKHRFQEVTDRILELRPGY